MHGLIIVLSVLTVIWAAPPTDPPITESLKASFQQIDTNNDGKATYGEFRARLYSLDTDNNGKIIYSEYAAGSTAAPSLFRKIFEYFDYDGDGHLDEDDLKVGFHQMDANVDKGVSLREFTIMYQTLLKLLIQQ